MRARSTFVIAAVAALLALGLAACGGGGSSSSSSEPTTTGGSPGTEAPASAETGSKPSGAPLVIGTVCSCTGVQKSSLGGTETVVKAWEQWVNGHGGINGHPVEVIIKDDGADPSKANTVVRELVEQDHPMAIVGYTSTLTPWAEFVDSKGIPVIGGAAYTEPSSSDPNFFPTGAPFVTGVFGVQERLKELGASDIAILPCSEAPVCAQTADLYKAVAGVVGGVTVPYVNQISSTQPSYTAQCLGVKSSGANALYVVVDQTTGIRVYSQCLQQGLTDIKSVGQAGTYGYVEGPKAFGDSLVQFAETYPMVDGETPASKEFQEALESYEPGYLESSFFNSNNGSAWTSFQLYKIVAEKAGLEPSSTPEDVKEGLYSLKGETVGGLTAPLTYTKGKPTFIPCYFLEETKEGGWEVPLAKPACMTGKQEEEIFAALEG